MPVIQMSEDLPLPSYAREGDAGLDLRAACSATLEPGERAVVPCGLKAAIPEGYAGLVIPRSGLAADHGITVLNAPGLIDSGYRGEIKAVLLNTDQKKAFTIGRGDRIAQLVIIQAPKVALVERDQLDITSRGSRGFGSSGA